MSVAGEARMPDDEAMTGRVVWVCENGHVDVGHKADGNHLDLCSRCKDGVCQPRRTLGRRSKDQRQRDRELGVESPSPVRREPPRQPAPVTVVKPGEQPEVVDGGELRQTPAPAFVLSSEHRDAILAGKAPRISFPRNPPADHPVEAPYPAVVGDVIPVAAGVILAVVDLRVLLDEIVLQYEISDSRRATSGVEGRYSTSKAIEKAKERMGGPEFRSEREPEQLPRRETAKIAARVHESELKKLRRSREDLGRHLKEQASGPRDVRFHLSKSIEAIDRRIENLEREIGEAA